MRALQGGAAAEGGGLLRVLLVRLGEMPAGAGGGRVLRAGALTNQLLNTSNAVA